jgi:hypothetical protein
MRDIGHTTSVAYGSEERDTEREDTQKDIKKQP